MSDEFEERPTADESKTADFDAVAPRPRSIGDYRIIRKLGEGGMGVVYEAEQHHPRRLVALKVIRGGAHVDETHLKMFHREARTLGRLKHPSIAAIYESGDTEDGQHFFAMELVSGATLSKWLRRRSSEASLSSAGTRLRLELFRKICEAVAYAHQRGVVHRDLKPSNILVTRESRGTTGSSGAGVPDIKILDFGLARITDSDVALTSVATQFGNIQGTLPYMSPEQFEGNPYEIELRTDVYSLGVVLYEMLTGRLPHDVSRAVIHDAARVICEKPPKPLSRTWRGSRRPDRDLETITMKALEKDPARRYQTVSALADDVEGYLTDQPITARPPSAVYQLRKMVARHRLGFGFVGSLVFLLAVLAISMTVQANLIAAEREGANQEAATAAQVSEFLVDLFKVADPNEIRGNTVTARELLDRGAERIRNELRNQPLVQARMMITAGNVYQMLGLYEQARPLLEESLEIRHELLPENHPEIAASLTALGGYHRFTGAYPEAVELYERALSLRQAALGPDHPDVAMTLNNLAVLLRKKGDYAATRPLLEEALAVRERTLGPEHPDVAQSLNNLANLLQTTGDYAAARPLYARSLAIREKVLGPDHVDVSRTLNNLAVLLVSTGEYAEARRHYERALAIRETALGPEHRRVAQTLNNLGNLRRREGDYDGSLPLYRRGAEIYEKALGPDHLEVGLIL